MKSYYNYSVNLGGSCKSYYKNYFAAVNGDEVLICSACTTSHYDPLREMKRELVKLGWVSNGNEFQPIKSENFFDKYENKTTPFPTLIKLEDNL
jgi:hypothetical protein